MHAINSDDLEMRMEMALIVYEWNIWRNTSFLYVNKNCDKLYWSSWTKTVNCSISTKQIYTKKCVDCDWEDFKFQNNCSGETTKIKQCYPSWSS